MKLAVFAVHCRREGIAGYNVGHGPRACFGRRRACSDQSRKVYHAPWIVAGASLKAHDGCNYCTFGLACPIWSLQHQRRTKAIQPPPAICIGHDPSKCTQQSRCDGDTQAWASLNLARHPLAGQNDSDINSDNDSLQVGGRVPLAPSSLTFEALPGLHIPLGLRCEIQGPPYLERARAPSRPWRHCRRATPLSRCSASSRGSLQPLRASTSVVSLEVSRCTGHHGHEEGPRTGVRRCPVAFAHCPIEAQAPSKTLTSTRHTPRGQIAEQASASGASQSGLQSGRASARSAEVGCRVHMSRVAVASFFCCCEDGCATPAPGCRGQGEPEQDEQGWQGCRVLRAAIGDMGLPARGKWRARKVYTSTPACDLSACLEESSPRLSSTSQEQAHTSTSSSYIPLLTDFGL